MDIDSKRIDALAKYRIGWKVTDICRSEGISRMTFYRWLGRYDKDGNAGLVRKSTRPHAIRRKIPAGATGRIIGIRKGTGANEYAIESMLRAEGIDVSHTSIYRILKSAGLVRKLKEERRQRTYIRYERDHPNSMWQADLTNWERKVVVAYIDDHSRFITGVGVFRHGYAKNVIEVFRVAIKDHCMPREVLTDHGSQFYCMKGGTSGFDLFCERHGIRHIMSGVGKPTTTGKIERWFGTFKLQAASFRSVGDYVKYYNYERPHKSLGYIVPAERYFGEV